MPWSLATRVVSTAGLYCGHQGGGHMGEVVDLFGGTVARLYRRSLTDQGFEVLMVAVFDIAARQGYAVARSVVKKLAAAPNIPLAEAWLRVLRHVGRTEREVSTTWRGSRSPRSSIGPSSGRYHGYQPDHPP